LGQSGEFKFMFEYLLTSFNFLQYRFFNRNRNPINTIFLLSLFNRPHSRILTARQHQKRVSPLREIKMLQERIRRKPQEGIIFPHFQKVIISLVNERYVRCLLITFMVSLLPSPQNKLLPIMNAFYYVNREHPQRM